MGKKSTPKAPDPMQTAVAQSKLNQSAAGMSQLMSMVNQVGPDGSLTYSQGGYRDFVDPFTGRITKIPNYTATTALSDAQRGIKENQDAAQFNMADLLRTLTGKFKGTLDTPFSLNNEDVENSIVDRYGKRLNEAQGRDRESMEADMLARGIRPGSAAYDTFKRNQGEKENDAWNQIFINARDQAINEKLTERNQPFKEFAALLSGSQIDQPQFGATPGANVANTDYAGLVSQNYQAKLAAQQAKQQGLNDLIGGLFGVGAAFAGNPSLKFSDRRLKTDIEKVGKTNDGQNIYSYRYKGGKGMHLGMLAQEVQKRTPEAVVDVAGFKAIDYRKALHLGA
ncbi:MAG: tail fiber domain-containing protein [Alphaproteobacteria bacterium]|nr:MAG: tail fiber domain-containing protein [Alphaproteobacteria bacterium]